MEFYLSSNAFLVPITYFFKRKKVSLYLRYALIINFSYALGFFSTFSILFPGSVSLFTC